MIVFAHWPRSRLRSRFAERRPLAGVAGLEKADRCTRREHKEGTVERQPSTAVSASVFLGALSSSFICVHLWLNSRFRADPSLPNGVGVEAGWPSERFPHTLRR